MRGIGFVVALALGWVAITGSFTLENLLLGAILAGLVAAMLRDRPAAFLTLGRLRRLLALILLFLKELLLGALGVARLVLTPDLRAHLRPVVIGFPLAAQSDAEIALLANLVTLTPGTLSVDVSADRKLLFVHALSPSSREALIRDIANGLEKKVIDVLR